MSQDELYAVTARVVDEFTSAAMLFTALDVSNAVKQTLTDARHRDISPIVRDLFERKGMGAYTQTQIDVMAAGNKPAKALLYHLPEQAPRSTTTRCAASSRRRRSAAAPRRGASLSASSTEAGVRIGKDGRGRVPRTLIENAGIRGDQVARAHAMQAAPKLTIVAPGQRAGAGAGRSALRAAGSVLRRDRQRPAAHYEHPSLLHVPRSMLDMFGQDPNLVARIVGTVELTHASSIIGDARPRHRD